jgi:hypothetical protein
MTDIDAFAAQFVRILEGKELSPRGQELANLIRVAMEQWPRMAPADRDALRSKVLKDIENLSREMLSGKETE